MFRRTDQAEFAALGPEFRRFFPGRAWRLRRLRHDRHLRHFAGIGAGFASPAAAFASRVDDLRHGRPPELHQFASVCTDGIGQATEVTQMTQTPEDRLLPESGRQTVLNPQAMSLEDAARLLSRIGGKQVTSDVLQADVDAGAPTNADGTINLVHFAAWLVKEMAGGD